jgi:hypothetical protein
MTEETTIGEISYRVVVLKQSHAAFGLVLALLSRHPPFSDSTLSQMAKTIRKQLRLGRNAAALSPKGELLAYAGWVPTLRASAELWVEDRGPLEIVERESDAMAMTIVVSESPSVTKALMRRAREMNPNMNWYFKRSYSGQFRAPRKQGVIDRTDRGGGEGTL